jgi:hypothetical protein
MKKNEVEVKRLKKLRLSRETLHTLTSSDAQKVVGGVDETDDCIIGTSPRSQCGGTL